MRQVFTSPNSTLVGYYKSFLDEAGIPSFIQNDNTNNIGLVGSVFTPSLCIIHDEDFDEAILILKSQQIQENTGTVEWLCPGCSEKNPPNFEFCWSCNTARPVG